MSLMNFVQQADAAAAADGGGGSIVGTICMLIWAVVVVVGSWKVFTKAGQPGWASLIPIYNLYVLLKIVGRPTWWLVLFVIPVVNFFVGLIVCMDLAKSFGRGALYGLGLTFFSAPFAAHLGLGDSQYGGPAAA